MEKLAINVKEAAKMMGIGLASMYTLVEAFRRWLDQAGENKIGG